MRARHREPTRSFVLGALAGAAVGFLFAPAPGGDTRAHIVTRVEHATAETREAGEKVVRKCGEAVAAVAEKLDRMAHR